MERTHQEAATKEAVTEEEKRNPKEPYQVVADAVRELGMRLGLDDTMFPVQDVLPLMERYALEFAQGVAPKAWVVDTLADVGVPWESMYQALEGMFYNDEAPFQGRNRRFIAVDIVYVVKRWFETSDRGARGAGKILGGEGNAAAISQVLQMLLGSGLDEATLEECRVLRARIEQILR